jgi:hypothetical protein
MSKFSQWLTLKIAEKGGFEEVQSRLNCSSRNLAQWMAGAADPNIEGQLALATALDVEFVVIRNLLGAPCNPFSEWLSRKILQHGSLHDFCLKVEMSRSKVNAWLNNGTVPGRWTKRDAAPEIRDALIKWGDTTPPAVLLAEIESLIDLAYTVKHAGKPKAKSKNKTSIPCHFAKMA